MEDVTDAAFRRLIARYSSPLVPRVIYTEFTSADGLLLAREQGRRKLLKKFEYAQIERPVVAQLFSATPEHIEKASALAADLGFDGIDINMGCPVDEVVDNQCGAALIKDPPRAREMMRAAKRGAPRLPISVKTRLGYNTDELETWLPELLAEDPAAITFHARTRKEMSNVPARWDRIARAVEIRNQCQGDTLTRTAIIGNGDVKDLHDARTKAREAKCEGVMLGRAVFGNPWIFANRSDEPTQDERVEALREHLDLFDQLLTGFINFAVMKKHFKAYISGWDGAKELRVQLMDTTAVGEAKSLLIEHSLQFRPVYQTIAK
ncbi:tRNA-dihydrouridine synthase [Candidatus Kaiserbacteria bacterium]|nr:tRNA-dihydrouridine synthase [Candidatus Kaiserbacteria bacterium]